MTRLTLARYQLTQHRVKGVERRPPRIITAMAPPIPVERGSVSQSSVAANPVPGGRKLQINFVIMSVE
jgi:hypothetical protein